MASRYRRAPRWRGVVAAVMGLTLAAGVDAPSAAAEDTPVYSRSDVLEAWRVGGPGVRQAAETALQGSDEDIRTFMTKDLPALEEQDLRVQVAQVMVIGGPGVSEAANTALDGGVKELQDFLDDGLVKPYDDDLRVRVSQIMAAGGPGVQEAAGKSLDGTPDDWRKFINQGSSSRPRTTTVSRSPS